MIKGVLNTLHKKEHQHLTTATVLESVLFFLKGVFLELVH